VILGFIGTRQVYFRGHLLISPKTLPTRRSSRPAFRFVRSSPPHGPSYSSTISFRESEREKKKKKRERDVKRERRDEKRRA
jgi:hypothetical protein